MTKLIQTVGHLLIWGFIATFVVLFFVLSPERSRKKAQEIERIESKERNQFPCEQYALVAATDGWFPCYNCGTESQIYLKAGEVWKYGKTCNGEQGRYPGGLPFDRLRYLQQFTGNEKECLLEEKHKIYNYPNLPECQMREIFLQRPPGNKIDR